MMTDIDARIAEIEAYLEDPEADVLNIHEYMDFLLTQLKAAREALKPFAYAAESRKNQDDMYVISWTTTLGEDECRGNGRYLNYGDLKRAAVALSGAGDRSGE